MTVCRARDPAGPPHPPSPHFYPMGETNPRGGLVCRVGARTNNVLMSNGKRTATDARGLLMSLDRNPVLPCYTRSDVRMTYLWRPPPYFFSYPFRDAFPSAVRPIVSFSEFSNRMQDLHSMQQTVALHHACECLLRKIFLKFFIIVFFVISAHSDMQDFNRRTQDTRNNDIQHALR